MLPNQPSLVSDQSPCVGESDPEGPKMSELRNCKFCVSLYWDRQYQSGFCQVRDYARITDTDWAANHCAMFKIDTVFNPAKMPQLIKCIDCEHFPVKEQMKRNVHCGIRPVTINNPRKERKCHTYKQKKDSHYAQIIWNTHGNLHGIDKLPGYVSNNPIDEAHAVAEINKHTGKYKFTSLRDVPFGVVSFDRADSDSSWRIDGQEVTLTVEGEIKMNDNMEKKIKEKQEKINKVVKVRKEYISNWIEKFKELDYEIRVNYIMEYSWLKKKFIQYITNKVEKKNRKVIKKSLELTRIHFSDVIVTYGKGCDREKAHLLSGDQWNFLKKILAIISKYATAYANERLKIKYSKLTSKYDALLYDDESIICESCGTENQIIALYCNSCGKKV